MRGQCVSGHVVRESFSDTSPKCIDRRAWKDAVQGLGKILPASWPVQRSLVEAKVDLKVSPLPPPLVAVDVA